MTLAFRRALTYQPARLFSTQTSRRMPSFGPGLHEYTSGRWLFNEDLRLKERKLAFDEYALANVICAALERPSEELRSVEKLAEGGFNRILQATFSDGKHILARLPFRLESPLQRSVSSEAATISFLHQQGIPVPKLLGYSHTNENPVGIEYILLEKLPGRPLGDSWFSLDNKSVAKVMKQIVDIEQRFMSIELPASGSIYFEHDAKTTERNIPLSGLPESSPNNYVVGPISSYAWDYRERASLRVDRGPWSEYLACFEAAARRELAYCETYGKPRHNVDRHLRELDKLQLQNPEHHAQLLKDYLKIAPQLSVSSDHPLARPTLRHPDFSPNNILVDDENNITGIIDWQHIVILPLCLCAGIPQYYQNWGDLVSESLQKPDTKLPDDFDSLSVGSQNEARDQIRRQLVHFYYAALTMKKSENHFDAFRDTNSMLRAKLYARAGAPWEGSSTSLEHVLVQAQQLWPLPLKGSTAVDPSPCPIAYPPERIQSCLERAKKQEEEENDWADIRNMLSIDSVGWIENDERLAEAKEMRETLRSALLKGAETDIERSAIEDHFPFDDHEED